MAVASSRVHPDATPVDNTPIRPKPHPQSGWATLCSFWPDTGELLPALEVRQHRRERLGTAWPDQRERRSDQECEPMSDRVGASESDLAHEP